MPRILTHILILSMLGLVVFNGCSLEKPTRTTRESTTNESLSFVELSGIRFVMEYFGFYQDRCTHIEHEHSTPKPNETAPVTTTSPR